VSDEQRLFAALELPTAAGEALARWGSAAAAADPALRALPAGTLHVTLHFLGERPSGELEALRSVVAGAPTQPIDVTTAGAVWLAPRRPHVLTCGLSCTSPALPALHAALADGLASAARGWTADARPLLPHVTVARVRAGKRPLVGAEPGAPELAFPATALALLRSRLEPGGARYETLERRVLHRRG
jgi:2'-5' RNA ligase